MQVMHVELLVVVVVVVRAEGIAAMPPAAS
jgi:hypothetical protein